MIQAWAHLLLLTGLAIASAMLLTVAGRAQRPRQLSLVVGLATVILWMLGTDVIAPLVKWRDSGARVTPTQARAMMNRTGLLLLAVAAIAALVGPRLLDWALGRGRAMLSLAALAALGVGLLPGTGAGNRFSVGPMDVQPLALGVVLAPLVVAGWLAARHQTLLVVPLRDVPSAVGPLGVALGVCGFLLVAAREFGPTLLLTLVIVVLVAVATRRLALIVATALPLLGGAALAVASVDVVASRVFPQEGSRIVAQLDDGLARAHAGGLTGLGLGSGAADGAGAVDTDLVWAAVATDLGAVGVTIVAALLAAAAVAMVRLGATQRTIERQLALLALGTSFIMPAVWMAAATARVLPFTGVPVPLLSAGKSSGAVVAAIVGLTVGVGLLSGDDGHDVSRAGRPSLPLRSTAAGLATAMLASAGVLGHHVMASSRLEVRPALVATAVGLLEDRRSASHPLLAADGRTPLGVGGNPEGTVQLGAPLVGYAGSSGHDHGLAGLLRDELSCPARPLDRLLCTPAAVTTTLDPVLQRHVQSVGTAYGDADIVLLDGRGALLAVSSRAALVESSSPGSAFKPVVMTAMTFPVPVEADWTPSGTTTPVHNLGWCGGDEPAVDLAVSCNTAAARWAVAAGPFALQEAAADLGLLDDHAAALGLTAEPTSVPAVTGDAARHLASVGLGGAGVRMTPLTGAVMAIAVDTGRVPEVHVHGRASRGRKITADVDVVAEGMVAAVEHARGTARGLRALAVDVLAKTGTADARFIDGVATSTDGWVVGVAGPNQRRIGFAVRVRGVDAPVSSAVAVDAALEVLQAAFPASA